ncbi:unnamed protein product [Trichogramma brassicae]|uniref:DNA-directed DNA polymerase n=1 Tax=Trichogramma brassicae TaxID=86971 RepID=A0A6H5IZP0_9HYME|nr:unnamed protein product [Trichogramma brassicae]
MSRWCECVLRAVSRELSKPRARGKSQAMNDGLQSQQMLMKATRIAVRKQVMGITVTEKRKLCRRLGGGCRRCRILLVTPVIRGPRVREIRVFAVSQMRQCSLFASSKLAYSRIGLERAAQDNIRAKIITRSVRTLKRETNKNERLQKKSLCVFLYSVPIEKKHVGTYEVYLIGPRMGTYISSNECPPTSTHTETHKVNCRGFPYAQYLQIYAIGAMYRLQHFMVRCFKCKCRMIKKRTPICNAGADILDGVDAQVDLSNRLIVPDAENIDPEGRVKYEVIGEKLQFGPRPGVADLRATTMRSYAHVWATMSIACSLMHWLVQARLGELASRAELHEHAQHRQALLEIFKPFRNPRREDSSPSHGTRDSPTTKWVPFVIYADFECVLKPVTESRAYRVHEAFSCGLYFDDELSEYRCYRKVNDNDMSPSEWFAQNLQNIADKVLLFFDNPKPMRFTSAEKVKFEKAKICHICKRGFTKKDNKVRDHSHVTGEYRGAAHSKCNINYRDVRFVPVIFHNLSGYDSHLFIREIATGFPGRVWVLPQTKERYISFMKFMEDQRLSFRFIDSFKFMASSLDKLASYLKQQPTLRKIFGQDYDDAQIDLLTKKGVFPYEYISSLEKLQETALPPPERFYSSLTDSDISTKDYDDAKQVWDSFKISNLGEYSDLYLKTDVLLLVEVFENFRKTCHEAYELDPAHYFTLPGYSWDAMLLYTQVELELLTDVDMLLFVEKGIRGGVSQCCSRFSEAHNRYMGEDYNPEKKDVYLMYYDVNNLYGWAMAQYLPYGGFEWDDAKDYLTLPEDSEYGYILEVDLEYPESLHDSHKDLPLCPEHACPPGSKQRKLLTTLKAKHKYVIHYRSLQQAVQLGIRVTKVHRALKFKQGPWLKSYIDLNTEKRKNGKNDFEKQQYKLCNNAIFGKTMENVRKRIDVKLVSSWDGRYGAAAQNLQAKFSQSCDLRRKPDRNPTFKDSSHH